GAIMLLFETLQGVGFSELILFLVLVIIGIMIILVLKAILALLLPIVASIVIWLLTRNLVYAGIAFIIFAVLQMALKRR
ncbi:MAG: hypothetical protein QW390_04100, partial [Candidatus Bathyarchaeia archaeon]